MSLRRSDKQGHILWIGRIQCRPTILLQRSSHAQTFDFCLSCNGVLYRLHLDCFFHSQFQLQSPTLCNHKHCCVLCLYQRTCSKSNLQYLGYFSLAISFAASSCYLSLLHTCCSISAQMFHFLCMT